MTAFTYRDGTLHAEAVPLAEIAAALGTPFYCYSSRAMGEALDRFAAALARHRPLICYAVKANGNLAVIRTLADRGAGADVVSQGELMRALAAGVPARKIVFAGVGKTASEMAAGLDARIHQFNVESEAELEALNAVAACRGARAPVALRVNPDVDALTHAKISTGKSENKFGIDIEAAPRIYAAAAAMPGIEPVGIALHIGSQLTELAPYRVAFRRAAGLVRALRGDGHAVPRLDLGGGLGIVYGTEFAPDLGDYAAIVDDAVRGLEVELAFEPGRLLVGNAGVLVTRVLYVKEGRSRRFVIVDAAMNDLIRPALYDAYHDIVAVRAPEPDAPTRRCDVVGPICESGDQFATGRALPPVAAGELLAVRSTGAYSAVMASNYNSRPLAPEVLVRDRDYAIIRARQDYAKVLNEDSLPPWLGLDAADLDEPAQPTRSPIPR
jgi:diaminopimelate decarboxylase